MEISWTGVMVAIVAVVMGGILGLLLNILKSSNWLHAMLLVTAFLGLVAVLVLSIMNKEFLIVFSPLILLVASYVSAILIAGISESKRAN